MNKESVVYYQKSCGSSALKCIENSVTMNKIIADNDYGIPPVRTMMTIYKDRHKVIEELENGTGTEHQKLGKIIKYVLQDILGYEVQDGEKAVNIVNVKTAMLYASGKHVFVE